MKTTAGVADESNSRSYCWNATNCWVAMHAVTMPVYERVALPSVGSAASVPPDPRIPSYFCGKATPITSPHVVVSAQLLIC